MCGSDMVSLEQTTKMHYMYPYDPKYVKEMAEPGFDAHLDLAKFAGVLSEEQVKAHADGKEDHSKIRKGYKAANYACTYGVRELTLSRQTGLRVHEAKDLIDAYWRRNWSLESIAKDTKIVHVRGEMWLFNPVSGFYYPLRYKKDIFSTKNQSTGVYCFDCYVEEVRKRRSQMTAQFHDEWIICIKKGHRDAATKLARDSIAAVNNKLKLNVELDIDIQFGTNYSKIH